MRASVRWPALVVCASLAAALLAGCSGWLSGAGKTVAFGMSAALSGPSAELGTEMKRGVETCLAAVNAAGGIHGRTFRLIAKDDGYDPERTKAAMRELVEGEKVFAILGNVGTPNAQVSVPYVLEKKTLFFGAFTGASLLRKSPPDRYVFNYRASYVEEMGAVVRYLLRKGIKPEEIAVFAQNDAFGDAGFEGVALALGKVGRKPEEILRVGFTRNALDVEPAVEKIVAAKGLRAVCTVAPYKASARFTQLVRDAGLDVTITNLSFVGSSSLAKELAAMGPRYAQGVIVTQVVPPLETQCRAAREYREALERTDPGVAPNYVSFEGYVAASALLEAYRAAGPDPTTDSVIAALESMRGKDLGIPAAISFSPEDHQGSHKVWGTVLDGQGRYKGLYLD